MITKFRTIARISAAQALQMGETTIKQPLPAAGLRRISPFLLLHHWGPKYVAPGKALDVGDHPHRGFEPITFLFEGEIEHQDSLGNFGHLKSGDVQWMTAGKGIIHSERSPEHLLKNGGRSHGIQLWVNLPKADKMTEPKYQDIKSENIPVLTLPNEGGKIRVIAGEYQGMTVPAATFTPILALHVIRKAGTATKLDIPTGYNAFTYNTIGEVKYNDHQATKATQLIQFADDGDGIFAEAPTDSEFLLLAGQPIDEPMAQYGPFVMNTQTEIIEAMRDYQAGKMGRIEA